MPLVKLLIVLAAIHVGMGFTQVSVTYFAGDNVEYNFIAETPLGSWMRDDFPPANENRAGIVQMGSFFIDMMDTIGGMFTYDYGFMDDIAEAEGFVSNVATAFRLTMGFLWFGVGAAVMKMVLDSGLLNSKIGFAVASTLFGIGGASIIVNAAKDFFGGLL